MNKYIYIDIDTDIDMCVCVIICAYVLEFLHKESVVSSRCI